MTKNNRNDTVSTLTMHKLIEETAMKTPYAIAISFDDTTISYKHLDEKANQLAHFLQSKGVDAETFIGVSIDRSIEMIISILGILKAGGVYIPIDPTYPKEQLQYMLIDSGISLLITQHTLLPQFNDFPIKKIFLDLDYEKINSFPKTAPSICVSPHNLAYVLYTSGSTGTPKGVMVCHKSVIHAYQGWETIYTLTNQDCHLQMANFSFDVFTGDLIRALGSGATLVLCPRDVLLKPEKLYNLMVAKKVNCAEFVPTVLRRLMEYIKHEEKSLDFMRILVCGSDNWSINEYRSLQRSCGRETRVINSYGLTEATIDSTYFEEALLDEEKFNLDHTVPLGKPFPNTEILLLDENQHIVPTGDIGEIYIGGPGLAKGYLNQPMLTEKKFIQHPFKKEPLSQLYKTGDLGRRLSDGNIEYLGRIDTQIKLRGMRIDLAGIENMINSHHSIRESLVTVQEDQKQRKRLVAYIVIEEHTQLDIKSLRQFLKKQLPSYMIPSFFIKLESLPITSNGKLDRQKFSVHILAISEKHHVLSSDSSDNLGNVNVNSIKSPSTE